MVWRSKRKVKDTFKLIDKEFHKFTLLKKNGNSNKSPQKSNEETVGRIEKEN